MNWGLPTSVEIGGESYEIRTDFRVILDIFVMLSDPDLSGTDRAEGILQMFYVSPEDIGKRLTVKHLTTVCLQSDKGQVKQLSLYSHTVFFATLRRTLRATVHFGAHTWESGVLIRSCARMHSSVLIREHLLSEKLAFALNGHS